MTSFFIKLLSDFYQFYGAWSSVYAKLLPEQNQTKKYCHNIMREALLLNPLQEHSNTKIRSQRIPHLTQGQIMACRSLTARNKLWK